MSIAPNKDALKRRLERYLWANSDGETALLQDILRAHFQDFSRVAIIGGLVRDFAREGRKGFRSDVDLVIDGKKEQVERLAVFLQAKSNRFGGFGFKQGPWKIDFWALETTWARNHVPIERLEDVVTGTFFDWDAIAYDLWRRRVICGSDYFNRIEEGKLDVNLLPNPSPLGNLVRAVRRLVNWDVNAGPVLRRFIDDHLNDETLKFVQSKEKELFSHQVSTRWSNASEAKAALLEKANRPSARQLDIFSSNHESAETALARAAANH